MNKAKHLNHFSHSHPLTLYASESDRNRIPRGWESSKCHLCGRQAVDSIYGCKNCGLFIHDRCAELKQVLTHPFHPEHALALYEYDHHLPTAKASSESEKMLPSCNACGKTCSNFIYHCAECEFYLGDYCINIRPQNKGICHQAPENSYPQHDLFICKKSSVALHCSFCKRELYPEEKVYICIQCKTSLDAACYPKARQIKHPFHAEHPLALVYESGGSFRRKTLKCNACSWSPYYGEYYYHCSQCNFTLHNQCASLCPTSTKTKSDIKLQNQPLFLSHCHPLIECDQTKELSKSCHGCYTDFEGSIFICLKCGIFLDKSCTELLPEIIHPFHPQHPLHLVENIQKKYRFECRGCKKITHFFTYVCWECNFYLEPRCAMIKPTMIKSRVHHHPLAFIRKKLSKYSDFSCSTCGGTFDNNFFQCVECEFGLHLECYPLLPPVIRHDCHCDPLRLNYSQIEEISDDESSNEEFYCYACEEVRDPRDPTYCCKDCPFVAHLHCVLSEIVSYIEKESAKLQLGKSVTTVSDEEEEDEAQTDSTHAPYKKAKVLLAELYNDIAKVIVPGKHDDTKKKKVARPYEEIARGNIAAPGEDLIKKKVAPQDTEAVHEKVNVNAQADDVNTKTKVATLDEDIVKGIITIQDEDGMTKKKASPRDERKVEENATVQEDIFKETITAAQEEIPGKNITMQDENIFKQKVVPPNEEIDKEQVTGQVASGIKKEVGAVYENIGKENVTVPDKDTIKANIAAINGEIAAFRTKLGELKERRKQLLRPQYSVNQRVKGVFRKILALDS